MVNLSQNTTRMSNNILMPSAFSKLRAPIHGVRILSRTSAFGPSRNKDRTGSHGSPCLSPHQRSGTPPSKRSVEHTLDISAVHTCARNTGSGPTMQRDGIFLWIRIPDFVEPVLYSASAGFIRALAAITTDVVRDVGNIVLTQQC